MKTLIALLMISVAAPAAAETCVPDTYIGPAEAGDYAGMELEFWPDDKGPPTFDGEFSSDAENEQVPCPGNADLMCYYTDGRLRMISVLRDEMSAVIWLPETGQLLWPAKCE